jgi:hypothetical protein
MEASMIRQTLAVAVVIAVLAAPATAATFTQDGYTIGSNLLGPTIVDGADQAGLGTFDLRANDTASNTGAYAWIAVWDSLWNVGEIVSITGIALPLRSPGDGTDTSNNTSDGTFTFTFYELSGGAEPNGWDGTNNGEVVLATATADFDADGSAAAIIPYVTFDSPINFNATSTGIAIHVDSTGSIRTRWDDVRDGVDSLHESRATGDLANGDTRGHQWTIAGTVEIPEPASMALIGIGSLAVLARRRQG